MVLRCCSVILSDRCVQTVVAMSVNKTVVGSALALPRGVLLCGICPSPLSPLALARNQTL